MLKQAFLKYAVLILVILAVTGCYIAAGAASFRRLAVARVTRARTKFAQLKTRYKQLALALLAKTKNKLSLLVPLAKSKLRTVAYRTKTQVLNHATSFKVVLLSLARAAGRNSQRLLLRYWRPVYTAAAITISIALALSTYTPRVMVSGNGHLSFGLSQSSVQAAGPTKQIISGGGGSGASMTLSNSGTEYLPLFGMGNPGTTETTFSGIIIPTAGKIKNLYVKLSEDPGTAPDAYRFTLRLNSASAALTVTIIANNSSGSNTTQEIDVVAGDIVSLMVEPVDTPSATPVAYYSLLFQATTAGQSIVSATYLTSATATRYCGVQDFGDYDTTETNIYQPIPTAGTFSKLYVSMVSAIAAGDTYTVTLRKNAATSVLWCQVPSSGSTASNTTATLAVAVGDTVSFEGIPTHSATASRIRIGAVFVSDTAGESLILGSSTDSPSTSGAEYHGMRPLYDRVWSSTESNNYQLGQACTLRKLYIKQATAPGNAKSYAYMLMEDSNTTTLTTTITGAATTTNQDTTHDEAIANGCTLSIRSTPSGTPTATGVVCWGLVCYISTTEDISNTPGTYGFGTLTESSTANTTLTYFTVTNSSGFAVDITIHGHDMTGGATPWTLSDTATAGADTYGLKAGIEGGDYTIVVKKNAAYNTLKAALAASGTQRWGLKIYAPTSFSNGDAKSGTVTLTASAS